MPRSRQPLFPFRPGRRAGSGGRLLPKLRSIQMIITLTFTAVTVLAAVVVSLLMYNKFAKTAEQNATLNMQQIIEQVNYNLNLYVEGMRGIYEKAEQEIGETDAIGSTLLKERLIALLESRADIVSFAVFTPGGDLVLDVPETPMRSNTRLYDQSWFNAPQKNSDISFSAPHIQNLFKNRYTWVVSLSKKVHYRDQGVLKEGILLVDFNFRTIDQLSRQVKLGKRGYAYILDSLGNIVYHPQQQLIYAGLKYENVEPVLEYTYRSYTDSASGEKRLITLRTLAATGWKIVGVAYYDEIITTRRDLSRYLLGLLAAVCLVAIVVSVLLSARIARPIAKLERTVQQVGEGDLHTSINVRGAYEVEQLSRRFNLMLQRIRQLMDQIIFEQETKRKGELEVLQAQINPHFLYNTLNSVIRLAEQGRNEEVVTMIQSLSRFFRISLSKGKNVITVQEELDHVRHYLVIQSFRFKNKFRYEIQADEEVLSCQTIKLILQPIVENAIYHGIEMMPDEGRIAIRATVRDGLVVIQVTDNGLGMSRETMSRLLTGGARNPGNSGAGSGSGVGVRNVNERIILYFGREYGLSFESELEEGTTVTVTFPAVRSDEGGNPGREEESS
ncbi:HAMP domain-containing protein [Paenibacillus spiritus]|uniref:histidine kinase n=1 Tax=Paenibacillus spiritus TaxID=2496557 RepID=A0A5J5GER6_9BACL|nr:HAMP domain-containing protein [Paenibacillus spiritus]